MEQTVMPFFSDDDPVTAYRLGVLDGYRRALEDVDAHVRERHHVGFTGAITALDRSRSWCGEVLEPWSVSGSAEEIPSRFTWKEITGRFGFDEPADAVSSRVVKPVELKAPF